MKINKEYILAKIQNSLCIQFESYSWKNMIDDTGGLTKKEKEWAKKHIDYKAYIM